MPEFLFEIGVEELPALFIEPATAFIKSYLEENLKAQKLTVSGIEAFGTPRRLVVMANAIADRQADEWEEVQGPSIAVAYAKNGELSPAGLGFVKAKGIEKDAIFKKTTDKGEVIAAKVLKKGCFTKDILPTLLVDMMRSIPFKKRMRWCTSADTFARPVRWMVCLYGGEYLTITYADAVSGKESRGHRFMAPENFVVASNKDYKSELKKRYVLLSAQEREEQFLKEAHAQVSTIGGELVSDPELLLTVRNLAEYPYAVAGKFEEKYLLIPQEILICELKTHQKCFAVKNKSGAMLPYFICSAAVKPYDQEVFGKGNAKVVRARFEDGAFYFAEDKKKTLTKHSLLLTKLMFERDLGTMADKSQRIGRIALSLAQELSLSPQEISTIEQAAPLLKADLVTGVVGQFPELQGVMGRIYASIDGMSSEIANAIEQHYWPRFALDDLPDTLPASLLSLADKLDTLVGVISIGKKPVGNKDPFALRRNAIGLVRILLHFGINIEIDRLIVAAQKSFHGSIKDEASEIKDFIMARARGLLIEDLSAKYPDFAVKCADSVCATGKSNILDIFARAHTLLSLRNKDPQEFESLAQAFKRASNIVKKDASSNLESLFKVELLSSPYERELVRAVGETKSLMGGLGHKNLNLEQWQEHYQKTFFAIAALKPKLDAFFDNVMVMVEDKNTKMARLALLNEIKVIADQVADFTHL